MIFEKTNSGSKGGDMGEWGILSEESESQRKMPELPESSKDRLCRMYIREIARLGNREAVQGYLTKMLEAGGKSYESVEDFYGDNPDYAEKVNTGLSSEEKAALRNYSGFNYKGVNSVLRGEWDYNMLGAWTKEAEQEYRTTADTITQAIRRAPRAEENFSVYRGTNLDAFRRYGVRSLEDLTEMQGQFHVEPGFSSTSMVKEASYAGVEQFDDTYRKACNIEIRYLVPAGCHEGVLMAPGSEMAYSWKVPEYLLNCGTMAYVSEVKLSEDGKSATVDMVVIPHEFYEE